MSIPVIIYHCGQAEYLKTAIKSAEQFNDNVLLIGNRSNKDYSRNWVDIDSLSSEDFDEFKKYYKLMASYAPEFDLIMFKKYFVFKELMHKSSYEKAFLIDSDLLTYCCYDDLELTKDSYAALSIPEKQEPYIWAASPHVSFWTLAAIDSLCSFIIETYRDNFSLLQEKYQYHLANKIPGGICDMTLLYLWSREHEGIYNTAKWDKNGVYEHCMPVSKNFGDNDFKMNKLLGMKKVKYIDEQPYLVASNNDMIKAYVLHFQGLAKGCMSDYYYGKYYRLLIDRFLFLYKKAVAKIKKLTKRH